MVTGAGPALDTTIIDVVDINANPAVCLAHHVRTGTGAQAYGEASDVAITPDGGLAIVNSRNWIHVVDLPSGAIRVEFNIGSLPAGTCNPSAIADSVACTDDRAIVTTTRLENNVSKAWVYILDLTNMTIALEHKLAPPTGNYEHDPHDVAITRDGRFAVVTASKIVGLYDLQYTKDIAHHLDLQIVRTYRLNVDSVEVTNNRALVTGDKWFVDTQSGATWFKWAVDVYDISAAATTPWTPASRSYDPGWDSQIPGNNRAHDLAIAPENDRALVRSEKENLVLHGFDAPPTTLTILASPNGANPLAGPPAAYDPTNRKVFTSDSVVIPPAISEGSQLGITIGTKSTGGTPSLYVVYVDFVNIGAHVPTVNELGPYTSSVADESCVAADLALSRDKTRVVVRSAAPIADFGATNGSDILEFLVTPPTLLYRYGATGNVFALDSVEVGRDRAISASEFLQQNPPVYPPPFFGQGWIQIVDL
jgi:hypothetical protein